MNHQSTQIEKLEKLTKLIKKIDFGMFTTIDDSGLLRSRPMSTQEVENHDTLWFFASLDTPKVNEILHQPQVNLSYANPSKQEYVSVSGVADIVRDEQKMKELWKPILKAWFPNGLEDPELTLVRVRIEQAEYWDSPNSTVVQAVGFVKALVGGESYEGGENEKIALVN